MDFQQNRGEVQQNRGEFQQIRREFQQNRREFQQPRWNSPPRFMKRQQNRGIYHGPVAAGPLFLFLFPTGPR